MELIDRESAERPLPESFRTLDVDAFECLPDGVLVVRRGRVAWASGRAAELFGTSRESLSGLPLSEMFEEGERFRLSALLSRCEGTRPVPGATRLRARELPGRPARVLDVRAVAAGGTLLPAAILSLRDASAMGRAERLVEELSSLADADPECLLAAAEQVFEALRWHGALWERTPGGARLSRILAPSAPSARGAAAHRVGVVVPRDRLPVFARVIATGKSAIVEEGGHLPLDRGPSEPGRTRAVWAPVRRGHRVTHVLAVSGTSVGERDEVAIQLLADRIASTWTESERRRALVDAESAAATARVASEIAGELQGPLTALVLASGVFARANAGPIELGAGIAAVMAETKRLAHIAETLLELARPIAPRVEEIAPTQVLLRAVAEAGEARPDVGIEVETAADLPSVRADGTLLGEAIGLLLTERLAHAAPGARIVVRAEHVGDAVRIVVEGAVPRGVRLAALRRTVAELGGQLERGASQDPTAYSVRLEAVDAGATSGE